MSRTAYWREYYARTLLRRRELARRYAEQRRRAAGVLPLSNKERYVRRICLEAGIPYRPPCERPPNMPMSVWAATLRIGLRL